MSKIDIQAEIMKHSDAEIVDYLYTQVAGVRLIIKNSEEHPEKMYSIVPMVEDIYGVLGAMRRRNDKRLAKGGPTIV